MSNVPLPPIYENHAGKWIDVEDARAHAAAVSAAKDAEIAGLRAELIKSLADNKGLRAEVAGLQIKADLFDLAVRKGLLSVHSELIDPRNHGTRCSWLEGHAKACDISNNAALAARKGEA